MEAQLRAFLDEAKVNKGETFTHTTKSTGSLENGWSSASYYIDDEYIDTFFTYYCNEIKRNTICTITERPGPYGPLRVDFDFKSSLDNGQKRQYDFEILKKIVRIYHDEMKKIIEPSIFEEKMLWCIILEKPSPRIEEAKIKDGFHLHFPHFICEGWIQDNYLRDKVTKRMIEEKVWENANFITPLGEIIDQNMAKKPWMMYGSVNYKNNKSTPYLLNIWDKVPKNEKYGHVLNENLEEIHIHEVFEDEMEGRKNSVKYYLPRLLSIRGFRYQTELSKETIEKRAAFCGPKRRKKKSIVKKRRAEDILEDIKTIKDGEIMSMISDDRSNNYDDWMEIGWTLFNIGQGNNECLELWIDFSRRSSKFVEGECEELWETMEDGGKTIASLFAMAKTDSPDQYKEWKNTNIRQFLWKSLFEPKPTEYDVAMVATKMFGDKFVCSDAKKNEWYYFEEHRWRKMDGGMQLRRLFVRDVLVEYVNLQREINKEADDVEYKLGLAEKDSTNSMELSIEYKKITAKKKRCSAIISALKTISFHKKLIEMCQLEMHDPNFHKKRNENRYLLGCENGVIDLKTLVFRDGRPDDYITFSTGIYYQKFNKDDEEVKELDIILKKFYPNKNRREYFLDFFASALKGGGSGKDWLIATGESDGGKSAMFKILETAYGSGKDGYSGTFSRENFVQATGRNSSSGPRPDLARIRGKRLMGGSEITKEEKVNIGFIKQITGGDAIWARGMYEEGDEIFPQFTLYTHLNVPPEIPGYDEAFWSRIRILDHESKFVIEDKLETYPVPETFEEQLKKKRFHGDENFSEKIPDLAIVLLWKLFERYKELVRNKRKVVRPKEVLLSTEMYQSQNDVYLRFITEKIEKEDDEEKAKTVFIRQEEMRSEFEEWYRLEYPSYFSRDKVGKSTLKKEINKKLGVIHDSKKDIYGFGKSSRWWGYRIIQDDEESEPIDDLLGKQD